LLHSDSIGARRWIWLNPDGSKLLRVQANNFGLRYREAGAGWLALLLFKFANALGSPRDRFRCIAQRVEDERRDAQAIVGLVDCAHLRERVVPRQRKGGNPIEERPFLVEQRRVVHLHQSPDVPRQQLHSLERCEVAQHIVDLAKNVFQLHRVDRKGRSVLVRRVRSDQLLKVPGELEPCLIGIEASTGEFYWQRQFEKLGHAVRIMAPQYVKPFVRRQKNDSNDAEAICTAVQQRNRRCAISDRAGPPRPNQALAGLQFCTDNLFRFGIHSESNNWAQAHSRRTLIRAPLDCVHLSGAERFHDESYRQSGITGSIASHF
jgi:hypothetical protein